MPTLVLIRGLPGSGKSTWAKKLMAEGQASAHVEADMFFVNADEIYVFNADQLEEAHLWCQNQTRQALSNGLSVVVSNTFTMKWELQPYLDMAAEFAAEVEILEAKGNWQNLHGVPDAVIQIMKDRWETL